MGKHAFITHGMLAAVDGGNLTVKHDTWGTRINAGPNSTAYLQVPLVVLGHEDNDASLCLSRLFLRGKTEGRVLLEQVRLASSAQWLNTWTNPFEVIDTEDDEVNGVLFMKRWNARRDDVRASTRAMAAWAKVRFVGEGEFVLSDVEAVWDENAPDSDGRAVFTVGEHRYDAQVG